MPDFNGINPEKAFGAAFNRNRKNAKKQNSAEDLPVAAANKNPTPALSPDHIYDLLSAQSGLAMHNVGVDGMERMMHAANGLLSPDQYTKLSRLVQKTYQDEFGSLPPGELLEEIVANLAIGQVVIQPA